MYRFKLKEIELGDTETQKGKKTTVSNINPETGAITWDIEDVADFSSTYKELEKAKDFLSKLEKTGKSKDDPAIDKLAAQIRELFNTFRTHIRKNYPEEYKRVLRLKESVNEAADPKVLSAIETLKKVKAGPKRKEAMSIVLAAAESKSGQKARTYKQALQMLDLEEPVNEQSEQWTQLDVNNINKSLRLALKTFNNLVRNLERLEGELGKHSNKSQGNLLQGMAPDSFDYRGVQNKLNKLYNAFSNVFSIDESLNEDSDEKLSIMKDENGKFIIGMVKGKYPRSKEAGPFDTQQKACEFFSEKGDFILNNLTEERLNEIDINKIEIIGDIYSSCEIPVNEGTFHGPREIAIYDGPDGETYIEKRGTGYYGYNNSFDFEAEDKAELKHKLNSWGYRLIAGSIDEGEGIGYLTPRAFDKNKKSTGASDIYYYKLGFKPVPKTKPKGFEVKQLFEKTDRNEFQTKRIASFNEIEERLNRIYPLLSNAKDATAKYYNENPGSYSVVYSTDYIFELLDEVEEKLKKTEDK